MHRRHFMRTSLVAALAPAIPCGAGLRSEVPKVAYPLKVSDNRRYLVDQNGKPFLMIADSPQPLITNISPSDAADFFAHRRRQGFNAVWLDLIAGGYTENKNADYATFDGIIPFTEVMPQLTKQFLESPQRIANLLTPNEAYFARADTMINLAADYGFCVLLQAAETGSFSEWAPVLQANGEAACFNYGVYVGQRYKSLPNIIWLHGNDYDYPVKSASIDPYAISIARGIQSVDKNHMHTLELGYGQLSTDNPKWRPIVSMNEAYPFTYPAYDTILRGYNYSPTTPVSLIEPVYEGQFPTTAHEATAHTMRAQTYWTILSGGTGTTYGNWMAWHFAAGWRDRLNDLGAVHMTHVRTLFASRAWYDLVPDQTHAVMLAGYGEYSAGKDCTTNNYVTTARTGNGSLVVSYLPQGGTITVDRAQLRGPAVARWFDPTKGTYAEIGSPLANAGTQSLAAPGRNADGDPDWVLVIEPSARNR